jgi:transcriptional regulator with XRE-family HTH domain
MVDPKSAPHEWSERIVRLATELGLTQAGLAERLGVSPATVSRWIQGKYEPTAEGYVALGNLAQRSDGIYFWERAGVDTSAFPEASFRRAQSSMRVDLHDFTLIASRKLSKLLPAKGNVVAIPLLNVCAYGDAVPPSENVSLSEVKVEEIVRRLDGAHHRHRFPFVCGYRSHGPRQSESEDCGRLASRPGIQGGASTAAGDCGPHGFRQPQVCAPRYQQCFQVENLRPDSVVGVAGRGAGFVTVERLRVPPFSQGTGNAGAKIANAHQRPIFRIVVSGIGAELLSSKVPAAACNVRSRNA